MLLVKTINEKVDDLSIAYIGGGSMNWARALMGDLALEPQLSGVVRLYDIDYEAAKANKTIGNKLRDDPGACGKWTYQARQTLEETLTGADFVIISILPGTFDEMESDVHTPEKYGIYQSVGDTMGPGGIVRSMRVVPMYVEIAEAIKAFCPTAWVINYTNPMSVCTGTLYRIFPDIKAFGCCHEIFHIQKLLAKMLSLEYENRSDTREIARDDIRVNALGINHFTWVTQASCGTVDLMPIFDKFAAEHVECGFAIDETECDQNNPFRNINKVCFDLYRRFNAIPAAGDRHIAEFLPPWYLENPKTAERFGFALTSVAYRKKMRDDLLKQTDAILSGREKFILKPSGEEGAQQIKALVGLSDMICNVNLPNRGQVEGLPLDAIVETNAMFVKDAARPLFAGSLPPAVSTMSLRHAENQKQLIEAGIRKDAAMAFGVFLNDSLMTLKIRDAQKLFGEMLLNTKEYLQGWNIKEWI